MNTAETKAINAIVALNTLHALWRADARGIYNNSPDRDAFDGSAVGYWERVAIGLGATPDEIAHAKDVPPGATVKTLERDLETARSVERGLRADLAGQMTECDRLRARVDEVTTQYKQAQDQPVCFIAQVFGYWGRGKTAAEAVLTLCKAGASRTAGPMHLDCFVGDAEVRITDSGMCYEFTPGTLKTRIGTFKTIAKFGNALHTPKPEPAAD